MIYPFHGSFLDTHLCLCVVSEVCSRMLLSSDGSEGFQPVVNLLNQAISVNRRLHICLLDPYLGENA
jgi:hypothetical protein